MSDTITIQVHRVVGFKAGQEVEVVVDREGTPLDRFWRRRLRDAKRDQCCEVIVAEAEVPQVDDDVWEEEPES